MKNYRYLLLFLLVSCFTVHSQEIEKIKRELINSQPDTTKVWQYRDLAYYYQSKNLDSAIHFATLGVDLAKSLKFDAGQIGCLLQVAFAYEYKDQLDSTFSFYNKALEITVSSQDSLNHAKLMNAIGSTHYFSGDYLEALTFFNKGLTLSESINYTEGYAHALNNIAVIYRMQRRYEMALEIYNQSLQIKLTEKDTTGIINSLYNIGLAYSYLNQYSKSLETFLEAKKLSESYSNINSSFANIDIGIGIGYFNLENYEDAVKFLTNGIQSSEIMTFERVTAIAYLGAIHVKEGRIDQGIKHIEEAYGISVSSGRKELLRSVLKERAIAYEKAKNFSLASESWKAYSAVSDSINIESRQWAIEELQARFELKDKENTISIQQLKLEKEASQKRWYLIFGVFIAVALLIISLFLLKILKQRKQLFFQISEKVDALHTNKLLLREMHHRTKNNLQLINSLLNLQSRSVENHAVQKSLESSRDSISAIGLLHSQLYNTNEYKMVGFKEYISELCDYFRKAFSLEDRNILLNCSCADFKLDIDRAIPLGLIINETVTNSIKHAFEGKDSGEIQLRVTTLNNRITIEVQDNGVGIQAAASDNQGTGTKLITMFSQKYKAAYEILNTQPGTLVRFSFDS